MKKLRQENKLFGQAVLFGVCAFLLEFAAVPASASSVIFESDAVLTQTGGTFTLPLSVDPAGSPQYTVRINVAFPPDLLQVASFAFSKDWIAVSQPGYDIIDNKRGTLVKTGGFPKGFSSPVTFGSIVFRTKGAGAGAVVVGPESLVLNEKNANTLEARPQILVTAAERSVFKEPSAQPLPEEPPPSDLAEKNIFDIGLVPEQTASRPSTAFFLLLFAVAAALGIAGRFIFVLIRRRLIIKKLKHDKELK